MTIFNLMKMAKFFKRGRKHCGKKRNCSLQAISPFPTVFSKDLHCRHVKTGFFGKGLMQNIRYSTKMFAMSPAANLYSGNNEFSVIPGNEAVITFE